MAVNQHLYQLSAKKNLLGHILELTLWLTLLNDPFGLKNKAGVCTVNQISAHNFGPMKGLEPRGK